MQAAAVRLAPYRDRTFLSCGDSRVLLHILAAKHEFPHEGIFFYLDAHWNDDLPLKEEIELIVSRWKNSVVMVDDFQVPDDRGYGFDCYSESRALRLEYLEQQLSQRPVFFPVLPGDEETGCKRGCVVFGTDEDAGSLLTHIKHLRKWTMPLQPGTRIVTDEPSSVPQQALASEEALTSELISQSTGKPAIAGRTKLSPRYLLVKAHVGSRAVVCRLSRPCHQICDEVRTDSVCVDWTDTIWSDGTIGFDTYFDLCGIPSIPPSEFYSRTTGSISPIAWANQLERRASQSFINKAPYLNPLVDKDDPAEVLVYGSVGIRTFYRDDLILLRVKREIRDAIVSELIRYRDFHCVVHLRGTDRAATPQFMMSISRNLRITLTRFRRRRHFWSFPTACRYLSN